MSGLVQGQTARPSRPDERRDDQRIAFDCPVRWSDGTCDRYGLARNISEGGAAFVAWASRMPPLGTRIRLVFELENGREWVVDEQARLVRCKRLEQGLFEVGVTLNGLS